MGILQQGVRRRKGRRMGEPRVVRREEVESMDLEGRVELIRALIPLGLLQVGEMLEEGFEETLTLHRLGVFALLGRSLKTTNCIESVLSQVEERCAKVDHWTNSRQKHRWLAASLLDIEPRLGRIKGYRHLPKLREALQREMKIENERKTSREAV